MSNENHFLYDAKYGQSSHTMKPQYEVRNNQVFRTIYHPQGASPLADFDIRDGKYYATRNHSAGAQSNPWFRVKGNEIHNTPFHPEGIKPTASFHMHPTMIR